MCKEMNETEQQTGDAQQKATFGGNPTKRLDAC